MVTDVVRPISQPRAATWIPVAGFGAILQVGLTQVTTATTTTIAPPTSQALRRLVHGGRVRATSSVSAKGRHHEGDGRLSTSQAPGTRHAIQSPRSPSDRPPGSADRDRIVPSVAGVR